MDSVLVATVTLFSVLISIGLVFFLQIFRLKRYVKYTFNIIQDTMSRRANNLGIMKKTISKEYPDQLALILQVGKTQKKLNTISTVEDLNKAESMLVEAVAEIVSFTSNHPSLLKDIKFVKAQENLIKIESKIVKQRSEYNAEVEKYNLVFVLAPQKWVAKVFRFTESDVW